jgi:hypothetical protein
MPKKYKCQYCDNRYTRADLISHIEKKHSEMIPQGYSAARVVYNQVNKVDSGKCRVCGKPTGWNEKTGRYDVLCGNPKCKEHMREEYKKNMLRVKGTYNILEDPEQQKLMLSHRSISGTYKFSDGGDVMYTGSYEKKCLEFMDTVMQISSKDILSPGPTLEYTYNGQKHFYITDFYYIPYNLIIEVKDGGENKNQKDSPSMRASREKTIEKERLITSMGEYNYIRLTDNNFAQLLEIFMDIKKKLLEGDVTKTYKINEAVISDTACMDVLQESKIFNEEDLYYNKDKFDSGEINLCFITGHSGSGKTTMGKSMAKDNVEHCELDRVVFNMYLSDDELKDTGELIPSYFKGPGKQFRYKSPQEWQQDTKWRTTDVYNTYQAQLIRSFVKYAISYSKTHKNKKFALEGIWIYSYIKPSDIDDYAVYIKGTSMLISEIRAAKRNSKINVKSKLGRLIYASIHLSNYWDGYKLEEKSVTAFRNYFAAKMAKDNKKD